jgi:hypothetical protein
MTLFAVVAVFGASCGVEKVIRDRSLCELSQAASVVSVGRLTSWDTTVYSDGMTTRATLGVEHAIYGQQAGAEEIRVVGNMTAAGESSSFGRLGGVQGLFFLVDRPEGRTLGGGGFVEAVDAGFVLKGETFTVDSLPQAVADARARSTCD